MSDATPPTTATANKRAGSPLFAETGANAKRAREGTQQNGSSSAAAGQDTEPNSAESNPNGDAKTKEGEGSATKEQDKTAESNGTGSGTQGSNMNDVNMDSTADAGPSSAATANSNSSSAPANLPAGANLPQTPAAANEAPASQISMRCLIVTQDASIIIGRGGAHVNEIRSKSNARVTVSESIPGNPERILNVSGPLDSVAKAFGLIVRRINDEPFEVASVPGSRAVTIKFIIPNSRMGSVIGKGGSKIKEIQEASGARLNASEAMLPGSTERVLSVSGVADAVHIAVYYIGTILLEYQERNPGTSTGSYRQPGARAGGGGGGGGPVPPHNAPYAMGPGTQTQQIYIPNALVGAIIGKGGVKINEIRNQSQCQIRVTEPGTPAQPGQAPNPEERLVTITGQPANINIGVQLLYSRLEAEKAKLAAGNNA